MRFSFWIILVSLVIIRYLSTQPKYEVGDKIQITGRITSDPIRYSHSQYLKLANLKLYLALFPEISYGDQVIIQGVVAPENKLHNPILISISPPKNKLYTIRTNIIKVYNKALPEPHSSLIAGIVLGAKSSLPESLWEALKTTGTAHVVVASGMNITLVAMFLINSLILIISRKKAVILALAGVWTYALLSGFDAPIIRAAIMGSIAFSAQALGKLYQAKRALVLSALIMLLINPSWLIDLGFILSFIATASLMLFERKIASLIYFVPHFFREGLSTSLAAQIGVAPILFLTFGQFNPLSPLINALILWTIPPITILGGIAGIIGLFVPFLARLILLIVFPLTWWFVTITQLFA